MEVFLENLPDILEKWNPTYNPIDGLLFYSDSFKGEMKTRKGDVIKKQVRYKFVFKTATIVSKEALHPQYILK